MDTFLFGFFINVIAVTFLPIIWYLLKFEATKSPFLQYEELKHRKKAKCIDRYFDLYF